MKEPNDGGGATEVCIVKMSHFRADLGHFNSFLGHFRSFRSFSVIYAHFHAMFADHPVSVERSLLQARPNLRNTHERAVRSSSCVGRFERSD